MKTLTIEFTEKQTGGDCLLGILNFVSNSNIKLPISEQTFQKQKKFTESVLLQGLITKNMAETSINEMQSKKLSDEHYENLLKYLILEYYGRDKLQERHAKVIIK